MSTNHEAQRRLIHGHFAGGLDPDDEARLRSHLPICAECRREYERHQMAERLDPGAPAPYERLAAALGLSVGQRHPRRKRLAWALASFAVAGAVASFVMVRAHGEDGISSRGAGIETAAALDLAVFRVDRQGESTRVKDVVAPDDELAFAYRNEVGKSFLMIFAVDSQNRVMWYHPAWTNSADNPQAVAITKQVGFKELPEAVRHPVQGSLLTLYALFLDSPLDVRAVESRMGDGAFAARSESGEVLRSFDLKVRP